MSEGGVPLSHSLLSSSPSLHGGRGATVSEGGRPSDLSALAEVVVTPPCPPSSVPSASRQGTVKTNKMLTIKRVETIVSINQQLDQAPGCGRDCLGNCCIPGQSSISHSHSPSFFTIFSYGSIRYMQK